MVTRVKITSRFLAEKSDVEKSVYKYHNFLLTEYLLVVFL